MASAYGKRRLVVNDQRPVITSTSSPDKWGPTISTCYSTPLSRNINQYPLRTAVPWPSWQPSVSQNLTGKVFKLSSHPVAGGAYSDVWLGEFSGIIVAIKVPRTVNVAAEKLAQVSSTSNQILEDGTHLRL
jgi:hypothetical protein